MSNLKLPDVTDYASALKFLGDTPEYHEKRVAYVTTMLRIGDSIHVRHHGTTIITYYADGAIRLNTGGWASRTTVNRMHHLTPTWLGVRHRSSRSEGWAKVQVCTNRGDSWADHEWRDLIDGIVFAPLSSVATPGEVTA